MSKSATGTGHAIALLEPIDQARKKIMRATTDSNPAVNFAALGGGVENLLSIFQAFSGWSKEEMLGHFQGMRYGDLKKQVAEMVAANLEPLQQRYREIIDDPGYVDDILKQGADKVAPIAKSTVRLVKERMGLYTEA